MSTTNGDGHDGELVYTNVYVGGRTDFDEIECGSCGKPAGRAAHGVALLQRCHVGAGVDTTYFSAEGVVVLSCHECDEPIIGVQVAETREQS